MRSAPSSRSCRAQVHGKPLVYLDNAASAQKPDAVIEAMAHAMRHSYANVHRGLHTLANETTQAYEDAREAVRGFINAAAIERDRLHQGRHGGDQHRCCRHRREHQAGRRDRALDHGAPFQHRAVALPARAQGRGAEVGGHHRRMARSTWTAGEAAVAEDEAAGADAHVQRAGHGAGCGGRHRDGAWGRARMCCSMAARRR